MPMTRLRFRLDSVNTFPSPAGLADLRIRTSLPAAITVASGPRLTQGHYTRAASHST